MTLLGRPITSLVINSTDCVSINRIVKSIEIVATGLVGGENFTRQTVLEEGLAFNAIKVS